MDTQFLSYFETELRHLREVCAEFASEFGTVAGGLDLSNDPRHLSRDPHVNMLLQGSAFLAARVHYKLDSEFPRFTQSLLEIVFPHFLCPVPSMAIAAFTPQYDDSSLATGFTIPKHTLLRGHLAKNERTACTFRTAHDLELWPVSLTDANYFTARELEQLNLPKEVTGRAALRLRFESTAGLSFNELVAEAPQGEKRMDRIVVHVRDDGKGPERGPGRIASTILQQVFSKTVAVVAQAGKGPDRNLEILPLSSVKRIGFEQAESLIPFDERSFNGFRLLREYFALPDRFLFFALTQLSDTLRRCKETMLDLVLVFSEEEALLEGIDPGTKDEPAIGLGRFCLYAVPCVNLFEREFDRVALSTRSHEYRVEPDKTLPNDYEVYSLTRVTGYGSQPDHRREFRPFFASFDQDSRSSGFFVSYREPRILSQRQKQFGQIPEYLGSETIISLVDPEEPPLGKDLRQLGFRGLCTNRSLPVTMARGLAETDFFPLEISGPFTKEIRCLTGPTKPIPAQRLDGTMWDLVNHLSLGYVSLGELGETKAAAALRVALGMYVDESRRQLRRQIQGLLSLRVSPTVRRVDSSGPITFARGVKLELEFDEEAFPGSSFFVLGMVLEEFFSRYVSINSFAETVISSHQKGIVVSWPPRAGTKQFI